jgi:Domain of unknown function (DUF4224)
MSLILTPDQITQVTGFKRPADQCAWVKKQLGLQPVIKADGRPVLTAEALTAAILRSGQALPPAVASTGVDGPNWSKQA